ncbi:hypothetical protein PHYSODRAFT_562325 [Phytophthora sojae]|uniref:Uncharacterized protein n=1 Tax=Phytophthora sojae (strain P6497) TaxID=1094619 RepID=G4ZRC6_PHYSP|nr:hypothetical protein PHYSODRAFT_562325 [Phytophthora sojae]EGZ13811.1 hypothetical protein PHYSODRAFT_562325 [Phytophthora sojae]|eukprot:XP_009531240.1 hypothetical protein PHYSODRAFT_562325 [Phytophthora sojae]
MTPSLSMEAVAAVEDAFLRGEWTQALNDSRSILAARIVQHRQEEETPVGSAVMAVEEERVLSVYLQAVFELDLDDEVETAATIARAFAPLPSGIAIQWSKFLVAMNRRSMATQALRDLLECYAVDGGVTFTTEQYTAAAEVLALQLLLPDEGIEAARQFVTGDSVLDDGAKLQLLRRLQAAHLATQESGKVAEQPSVANQTTRGERQLNDAFYQSASSGDNGLQRRGKEQGDDDSSSYVMLGGTAIALAVAAAGALRYREKIHECVSNAIPAISKGLADAKYALFEA